MPKQFSIALKIILPVAIGFGVIYLLFGNEVSELTLTDINWSRTTVIGIAGALLLLLLRETGLAWRFKALTDGSLKWSKSFKVSLICDFTSAITPTSAGGSVLSMIFLNREGISLGRSTAITLVTLFLDELFFVIAAPILMLLASPSSVFGFTDADSAKDLMTVFWIVYAVLVVLTALLFVGIFFAPQKIANGLTKMFSLPLIRRWKNKVAELGDNLVKTSSEIRHKPWRWWIVPTLATFLTWLSRFLIVNALFFAFFPETDQLTVLARQFVVWGLLIFMPTPGGSGVSEMLFKTYYSDMVGGPMLALLAISWRVLTYYVFLIIGVLIIPSYLSLSKSTRSIGDEASPC